MSSWDALVEATIDAIHLDVANKTITIDVTCPWEGRARRQIVATDVDEFLLHDMRLANVIDRVTRYGSDSVQSKRREVARRVFWMMRGKEASDADLEWPALKEKLDLIHKGALELLEVEPVHGATMLVLARQFKLAALH